MVDLHSHILHGIDDGPREIAGSLAMARVAADGGTRTIVATPHVNERITPSANEIAVSVAALNLALARNAIGLEVAPGAELALTRVVELEESERQGYALGQGPWLLVESPYPPEAGDFDRVLFGLAKQGAQIVLAHPERCPTFQREPERLRALVDVGLLCQITAGSLSGQFGTDVRRFAMTLLREDLVHAVASDGHDARKRPPLLADGLAAAARDVRGIDARREWLTEAMPAAILAGAELPPAPERARRGLRRWLGR